MGSRGFGLGIELRDGSRVRGWRTRRKSAAGLLKGRQIAQR